MNILEQNWVWKKIDTRSAQLADDSIISVDVVSPLEVRFANRKTISDAMVMPGETEVFWGLFLWKQCLPDYLIV